MVSLDTLVQIENKRLGGTDMSILGAVIVPHPPLIIPTVGRGREQEVQDAIDAYWTAAKQAAAWEPEVLIITSPTIIAWSIWRWTFLRWMERRGGLWKLQAGIMSRWRRSCMSTAFV